MSVLMITVGIIIATISSAGDVVCFHFSCAACISDFITSVKKNMFYMAFIDLSVCMSLC